MAKKVTKKTAKKVEEPKIGLTTKIVAVVLIFAAGFVIGCACSARSVYNSNTNEPAPVNAIEPAN